jgi:predicted amidophosphoribosyltransferase
VDGNRDYRQELASLQITDSNLIKGKTVLLLDDIKTQGNSLNAGKTLLLSHGAKQVIMFALGKTSQ